jgi:tetratricopeptide (TPR) repeat protein
MTIPATQVFQQRRQAEAHNALGIQYAKAGRLADAEHCFRKATASHPDFADALENLGLILLLSGRAAEALPVFTRRAALGPLSPVLKLNYSTALLAHDRMQDAERMLRQSEAAAPTSSTASNLGNLLRQQGQFDEAMQWFNRAVERAPQVAEYRYNRALALLLAGRYQEGWADYEWRRRKSATSLASRNYVSPLWDGSTIEGTLFIYPEQGLGDTLQFVRFLPEASKRVKFIKFECPTRQRRLLKPLADAHGVEFCDAPPASFAAHTSLMSLPHALGLHLEDIAGRNVPYLTAEPELTDRWRTRINRDALNIGIAWQGSPDYPRDAERSIPLPYFTPILNLPSARLISLQKGYGAEQIAHFGAPILEFTDMDDDATFIDTAALLKCLDLVITSDTSIAHLAGAMGVKTWLLLPFVPDWRWMTDREDTPWYPSLRLFRQHEPGDWSDVFERVIAALKATG